MLRIAVIIAACVMSVMAQTTISDTILSPFGGGNWTGKIRISCPRTTSTTGGTIALETYSATVTNGVLSITIRPYDTASPSSTCTARYEGATGVWQESWLIPTSGGSVKVSDILRPAPSSGTVVYVPAPPLCAATPPTTGAYRNQCLGTDKKVYTCANSSGCTLAGDWGTGGGATLPSVTNLLAGDGAGGASDSGLSVASVATLSGTQSLTNKTLDGISPTIMGYLANVSSDIQSQISARLYDPLTTRGDIIYRGAEGTTRLALGSMGYCITSNGTDAVWGVCPTGSHASSHASAGSDPVALAQSQVSGLTTALANVAGWTRSGNTTSTTDAVSIGSALLSNCVPQPPVGADYYVDAVNGSDSATGTSATAAFKTLAKLSTVLTAGKWAALNGDFNEALTLPTGVGTRISTYGCNYGVQFDATVPAPAQEAYRNIHARLRADDVIAPGAWTKTDGQTSVYQATLPGPNGNTPSDPGWYTSVWESDYRYTIKHSVADVDATASSYYATQSGSTITLYVHTSDGANPATKTKMEYAARLYGLDSSNCTGCTISGIHARRSISANGSIALGPGVSASDLLAEDGTKHNLICCASGANSLTRVWAKNAYYEGLGNTSFIAFSDAAHYVAGSKIALTDSGTVGTFDSTAGNFYSHGDCGRLVPCYDSITLKKWNGGISYSSAKQVVVEDSTINSKLGGDTAVDVQIRRSNITNPSTGGNGGGIVVTALQPVTLTVDNCVINGPSFASDKGISLLSQATGYGGGGVVKLTNSIIQGFQYGFTSVAPTTFYSRYNTIDVGYAYLSTSANTTVDSDFNNFAYWNTGAFAQLAGGAWQTFATWQGNGYDTHPIKPVANPKWNFSSAYVYGTGSQRQYLDLDGVWTPLLIPSSGATVNAGYVSLASSAILLGATLPAFSGAGTLTAIAVIRTAAGSCTSRQSVIGITNLLEVGCDANGQTNKFTAYIGTSGGGFINPSTSAIDDGNWHSIIVSYDGGHAQGYVDGTAQGAAKVITGSLAANTSVVQIGANGGNNYTFTGDIAYVELIGGNYLNSSAVAAKHTALKTALAYQGVSIP